MNIEKIKELKTIIAEYDSTSENDKEKENYIAALVATKLKGDSFFINAININSRGHNGVMSTDSLKELAETMLMNHGACHTLLWEGSEKNTIQGVCFHHEVPTGTWFNLMSMEKAKEKGLVS